LLFGLPPFDLSALDCPPEGGVRRVRAPARRVRDPARRRRTRGPARVRPFDRTRRRSSRGRISVKARPASSARD